MIHEKYAIEKAKVEALIARRNNKAHFMERLGVQWLLAALCAHH